MLQSFHFPRPVWMLFFGERLTASSVATCAFFFLYIASKNHQCKRSVEQSCYTSACGTAWMNMLKKFEPSPRSRVVRRSLWEQLLLLLLLPLLCSIEMVLKNGLRFLAYLHSWGGKTSFREGLRRKKQNPQSIA